MYFCTWGQKKEKFSKNAEPFMWNCNPTVHYDYWIRILIRICNHDINSALLFPFKRRRLLYQVMGEMLLMCLMNYSLFSSLYINIIPEIQGKNQFWKVSSFEQEKRQQPDLITAFGLISFMKLLGLFPHKYSKMYRFCRPQLKLWERILHLGYYQQRFHPNGLMGDWR